MDGTCGCYCEMWLAAWGGAARCVQGKVKCSAVVLCSAVGSTGCVIPT